MAWERQLDGSLRYWPEPVFRLCYDIGVYRRVIAVVTDSVVLFQVSGRLIWLISDVTMRSNDGITESFSASLSACR